MKMDRLHRRNVIMRGTQLMELNKGGLLFFGRELLLFEALCLSPTGATTRNRCKGLLLQRALVQACLVRLQHGLLVQT